MNLFRPLVVPIAVGGAGLLYGAYDISYLTTNALLSIFVNNKDKKTTFKIQKYIFVAASGGSVIIARRNMYPPRVSELNKFSISRLVDYIRINRILLERGFITLTVSGCIAGIAGAIGEAIF